MKTVEHILISPVRFRKAMDLIFSLNPQKTVEKARVWREASLMEEVLGEVVPVRRGDRLIYKVMDSEGLEVEEVYRMGDTFNVLRSLDTGMS